MVVTSGNVDYIQKDDVKSPDRLCTSFCSEMTANGIYVWAIEYPRNTELDLPIVPLMLPNRYVGELLRMQLSGRLSLDRA